MNQTLSNRSTVLDRLFAAPYQFDFFQAVRLLEWQGQSQAATGRLSHPVGEDYAPETEVVRFRSWAAQRFPSSSIIELVPGRAEAPPEMTVSFMGLTGTMGVLPQHYTQRLIDQLREDVSFREFFDIFNHRAISLFYRAWKKHCFPVAFESHRSRDGADPGRPPTDDVVTAALFALVGFGTAGHRGRQCIPDAVRVYYGGSFVGRPPTSISLERLLGEYFSLPVKIVQFIGQWLCLSPEDQTRLPGSRDSLSMANCQLGVTSVAGNRVWSIENRFRVRVGPLSYSTFLRLMPMGDTLEPLAQFVRSYVGLSWEFDVQPVLRREEVPSCELSDDQQRGPRLGWNTWILSRPLPEDADDAIFYVEGIPSQNIAIEKRRLASA